MKITNFQPSTLSIPSSTPTVETDKTVQVFIEKQAVQFGIGNGEQRNIAKQFLSDKPMREVSTDSTPTFAPATGDQKLGAQTWILTLKK